MGLHWRLPYSESIKYLFQVLMKIDKSRQRFLSSYCQFMFKPCRLLFWAETQVFLPFPPSVVFAIGVVFAHFFTLSAFSSFPLSFFLLFVVPIFPPWMRSLCPPSLYFFLLAFTPLSSCLSCQPSLHEWDFSALLHLPFSFLLSLLASSCLSCQSSVHEWDHCAPFH